MSAEDKTARRYHWLSDTTNNFVVEPHNAIVCDIKRPIVLNMTAAESEDTRKASVDLAKEPTRKLMRLAQDAMLPKERQQKTLQQWVPDLAVSQIPSLDMPRNINWNALAQTYEMQPSNYEELLSQKGVGPATVRGLALIAELVYGEKPSWQDPVKYSFAYGGKDGVPYPVNREAMDQSIQILRETVEATRIGDKEKTRALQSLRRFVAPDAKPLKPTSTEKSDGFKT
jgi:hypothetical protein